MPPKELITGAAGNLGWAVTEILQQSYDITLSDVEPFVSALPFEVADVRRLEDVRRIIRPGYEVLIHTAAWHGIHAQMHQHSVDLGVNLSQSQRRVCTALRTSMDGHIGGQAGLAGHRFGHMHRHLHPPEIIYLRQVFQEKRLPVQLRRAPRRQDGVQHWQFARPAEARRGQRRC